jgi:hypothetical protein
MTMSGNAALRLALDEASKLRFPHEYTETLERLRREFGHSISMLSDGSATVSRASTVLRMALGYGSMMIIFGG